MAGALGVGQGSGVAELGGQPFAGRHGGGAVVGAPAQVAADVRLRFRRLRALVQPDIAIIVLAEAG
ncbi:MAG: hypothetical protein ACYCS2_09105 [Acidimicrobiales bacterium]